MKKEAPQPVDPFGFTEREKLFDRISDQHLQALLADENTCIHEIQLSTNTFGEFLFVTLSRTVGQKQQALTFFGLGFHEYRERWISDFWSWYETSRDLTTVILDKAEAVRQITERRNEIASHVTHAPQSQRAKLYELLAYLTDEDGAYIELEDMGDLGDWLDMEE